MNNELSNISFLDIQYAWSNDNQMVFFIPKEQYTEENIKKFNEIKQSGWYLAIAMNAYKEFKYPNSNFDLPLYQHGYYDLLLNSDYRIVAYKRTYYGEEKAHKLTLSEFKNSFVYNERRNKLYDDFERCMSIVNKLFKISSIRIAGSFVEDKENPGDMDVMLFISEKEFAKIEANNELYNEYKALIFPHIMKQLGYELHIRIFVEKDINLENCKFDNKDENISYLCKRGYVLSLYNQKTINRENHNECYIHNLIRITE